MAYFGQYRGATGGLLPSGITAEMGKAGQYLASGMQQLGAGLGKGIEEYRKNKEKKEILTERAEWIADQKEAELQQWLQDDPSKIDTPDGDQKVKEIQKFRDKIHSASTSQLTSMVANEMLEYERQGKELDRQIKQEQIAAMPIDRSLKQKQIDSYNRQVTQDAAAADVYGDYRREALKPVRETVDVPAVYETVRTPLGSINELMLDSEMGEGRQTFQERLPEFADRQEVVRQIDDVIGRKEKLISEFEAQAKSISETAPTSVGSLFGTQLTQLKDGVSRLETDIADLEYDKDLFIEGEDLSPETIGRLSGDVADFLDPITTEGTQAELLKAVQGQPSVSERQELVSEATTKTIERPKTVGERRQLMEEMIAKRAGDLGVAGIKSVRDLSKSVQPEVQEIGGFKYIVSPTGAFQLLPGQEQGTAATPAQIRAMAAMGYKPKTATLKMGNGVTMQMEVPPADDGTKRSEGQAQAYLHSGLMSQSEEIVQKLEDSGEFNAGDLTEQFELYHDVNLAKSPEAKQYAAAMNKWIEGYLRYVSGAAIAEHEYKGARAQFFPVAGDTAENKEIKRKRRATTVNLLKEISGGGNVKKLIDHAASLPGGGINLVGRGAATAEEAAAEARAVGMKSGDSFRWYDKNTRKFYPITLD